MRLIAADWGTSRLRAYRIVDGRVTDRAEAPDGVAALKAGEHPAALERVAGRWLAQDPGCPVILLGMVGSREGWAPAPYAPCPAGAQEIAAATLAVPLPDGRQALIVPGLLRERGAGVDVMRGEETLALGAGIADGTVCLPGTHSKWVTLRGGRIVDFATYMTGEMYGLLRHHAIVGRPATEPADPAGFEAGLAAVEADEGRGLLHLAFAARAAVVSGRMAPAGLGPFLSGLTIGTEIAAALGGGAPPELTLVADALPSDLYRAALERRGAAIRTVAPEAALVAGLQALALAA